MGAGERERCMTWERPTIAFSQSYSFLPHPPAARLGISCMSLGSVMLMQSSTRTLITGLSGTLPLPQFFTCPRICPFSPSIYCLHYFITFRPQMLFFPKWPLLFHLRTVLLKPGPAMSTWKLKQKGFNSRFPHGIKQRPSVTVLCLSFFTL